MKNIFQKILNTGIKETVESAGTVIDKLTTSDQEKLTAKNELTEIVTKNLTEVIGLQTQIVLAEAQGGWLQRNWRPIIMLAFGFIVVYSKFIAPAFGLPNTELEDKFWTLLELGVGGYVIGRTVEKVSDTVTKNIDISMLRKKDRKDSQA